MPRARDAGWIHFTHRLWEPEGGRRHRFLLNLLVQETALSMGLTEANVKVIQIAALERFERDIIYLPMR
jgi:hypothetical protein